MGASIIDSRATASAVAIVESSAPTFDFPMEQVQTSPLLATTQGKLLAGNSPFFLFLLKPTIEFGHILDFFMALRRLCISY